MLEIKNEDPMKVAVLNELLNKHHIEHSQIDKEGTACMILIDDIQFWIISGGKIRYTSNCTSPLIEALHGFQSTGKTTDAFLYIIKTWLSINNQLED